MTEEPLLAVHELSTRFPVRHGEVRAVEEISFELRRGDTLGIVGESGSGKTMTLLSLLGLVPPPGRVVSGEVRFHGLDLLRLDPERLRQVRGRDIAMIFQDPMTSLNPVLRVGGQIEEAMVAHGNRDHLATRRAAVQLLREVGLPDPEVRAREYPHELSGGMRQRVMIAMALANRPEIVIADEPTTALDVTIQAQILSILRRLNAERGTAIVLVTHNLGVVANLCRRVLVMYAGRVVERGPTADVFANPQHPYTWSLLRSIPRLDTDLDEDLVPVEGLPPDLGNLPSGCAFHPRCRFRVERCEREVPELLSVTPTQAAACWVTQSGRRLDDWRD